jgi:pyruvyltransferase
MGDVWTPHLLRQLGCDPIYTHPSDSPKLLATGSIIRFAKPSDTVWGSGLIDSSDEVCRESRYLCVRGPLTGERVGCDVYGDPGLLAPLFVSAIPKRSHRITVIAHYVHLRYASLAGWDTINPITENVASTIAAISSCHRVVASSLHGIIFAHAYGIPAGWWRPDDALTGDDVKFRDYAESVEITLKPSKMISEVRMTLPKPERIQSCQNNLMRSWKAR